MKNEEISIYSEFLQDTALEFGFTIPKEHLLAFSKVVIDAILEHSNLQYSILHKNYRESNKTPNKELKNISSCRECGGKGYYYLRISSAHEATQDCHKCKLSGILKQ